MCCESKAGEESAAALTSDHELRIASTLIRDKCGCDARNLKKKTRAIRPVLPNGWTVKEAADLTFHLSTLSFAGL
jgi:hypothetical protein